MNREPAPLRQRLPPFISLSGCSLGGVKGYKRKHPCAQLQLQQLWKTVRLFFQLGTECPLARGTLGSGSGISCGREALHKQPRSCGKEPLCSEQSPVLPLGASASPGEARGALTFEEPGRPLPLLCHLQAHRDVQELFIAVSIPHKELLVLVDLLAALVKYLPLTLHCNEVLLSGETGAVDVGHPVSRTSFPIYKVAQKAIFKDLNEIRHEV